MPSVLWRLCVGHLVCAGIRLSHRSVNPRTTATRLFDSKGGRSFLRAYTMQTLDLILPYQLTRARFSLAPKKAWRCDHEPC